MAEVPKYHIKHTPPNVFDELYVKDENDNEYSRVFGGTAAEGIPGPKGDPGKDGIDGRDGVDGLPGRDGVDGQNGVDGINGKDGEQGIRGQDGRNLQIRGRLASDTLLPTTGNTDGDAFVVGDSTSELSYIWYDGAWLGTGIQQGPEGAPGKDGINGRDGTNGKDGLNGSQGIPGVKGDPGADGANNPNVYQRNNIIGPVSQTGGVPTGALIGSGSNTNGRYIKYADGTMICWRMFATTQTTNRASGVVFQSDIVNVTFPQEFATKPVMNPCSEFVSGIVGWGWGDSKTTTNGELRLISGANNAQGKVGYIAIGRWY